MEVVKRRTHSLKNVSQSYNILIISFFDHLNGKARSEKMGLVGVLMDEENGIIVAWI
jgi:hypothetical protein